MSALHRGTNVAMPHLSSQPRRLTKYSQEIMAALLWFTLLTKMFVFDLDTYILKTIMRAPDWVISAKPFLILAAIFIVWRPLTKAVSINFYILLIAYPFVLFLYRIPKFIFKNMSILLPMYPLIASIVRNFRLFVLSHCLLIILIIFGMSNNDKTSIYLSISMISLFAVIYTIKIVVNEFSSSKFNDLVEMIYDLRKKIKAGDIEKMKSSDAGGTTENVVISRKDQGLINIYLLHHISDAARGAVSRIRSAKRYEKFSFLRLLYIIFISSLLSATVIMLLHKIDSGFFKEMINPVFLNYLLISFTTLSKLPTLNATPSSLVAKNTFLVISAYGWFIYLFFVSMLFGFNREHFNSGIKDVFSELRGLIEDIDRRLSCDYSTNINSLEMYLLGINPILINFIRKTRGLSEISNPSAPEISRPLAIPATEKRRRNRRDRNRRTK